MKHIPVLAWALIWMLGKPAFADGGVVRGYASEYGFHTPIGRIDVTLAGPAGSMYTVTRANGFFAFVGVLPGTYTVSTAAPWYHSPYCGRPKVYVHVGADEVVDVDLRLEKFLHDVIFAGPVPCVIPEPPSKSLTNSDATADVYDVQ